MVDIINLQRNSSLGCVSTKVTELLFTTPCRGSKIDCQRKQGEFFKIVGIIIQILSLARIQIERIFKWSILWPRLVHRWVPVYPVKPETPFGFRDIGSCRQVFLHSVRATLYLYATHATRRTHGHATHATRMHATGPWTIHHRCWRFHHFLELGPRLVLVELHVLLWFTRLLIRNPRQTFPQRLVDLIFVHSICHGGHCTTHFHFRIERHRILSRRVGRRKLR